MRVHEIMTREVKRCRADESLAAAARIMWENDCGCVPVVDGDERVIGIVTDRDVCMAAYTQGKAPSEITVDAAMAHAVATCAPDDPVDDAERTMQRRQVRRLPVVDGAGRLVGILSLNDLARFARAEGDGLSAIAVEQTLAAVCAGRIPPPVPAA